MIPITMLDPTPTRRQGIDEFMNLSEEQQKKILGPGKWQGWKDGRFELKDIVKNIENTDYGSMKVPKTMKELMGEE